MPGPRRTVPALLLLLVIALPLSEGCRSLLLGPPGPGTRDVRILRDTWGVPHVFGKTDADTAFGLAYAHAEDDYRTIELSLLASRGQLSPQLGFDGIPNDYLVGLLRISETVAAGYERDLTPRTRALVEAYADGLNHYARLHPDEVQLDALPWRGQDIVAGFVHKTPLFFGLQFILAAVFDGKKPPSPGSTDDDTPSPAGSPPEAPDTAGLDLGWLPIGPFGSNAFAVAPSKSADGHTRLAVNSHQPWTGPVAWYEAHLHSEEGLDIVGGLFPGSPLILHGHNRHLGWAHTVNFPDLIDVYRLEVDGDRYRYGEEWLDLDLRDVTIEIGLYGPIRLPITLQVGWSVHGPVFFNSKGEAFAVRYAGLGDIRQVEQNYRMNRAVTFPEWLEAMRMQAYPSLNSVYADETGHIFYLYNARAPRRAEGPDWTGVLDGSDPTTMWQGYHPFSAAPQVLDPRSGFVQSCNSTPFEATLGPDKPRADTAPPRLSIEPWMTNRSLRALELYGRDPSITAEEFIAYKFDLQYSTSSWEAETVKKLLAAPAPTDPLLIEAREVLARWDLRTDPDNTSAALGVLTLQPLVTALEELKPPPDPEESLAEAARVLKESYGRLDVPWHEVNRLKRGETNLGLGGGPDILHAVDADAPEQGQRAGRQGDSYVLIADWGPEGVTSQSIHVFGSATVDEKSPHYADQSKLFVERKLKPVWLDEADIRAHLEREYRPGGEIKVSERPR